MSEAKEELEESEEEPEESKEEEERVLEMTLVSARNLKDVNFMSRMETYAIVRLAPYVEYTSRVDARGGVNPRWDETFGFVVPEALLAPAGRFHTAAGARAHARAGLMKVEIHTLGTLGPKFVGDASIPLSDISTSSTASGQPQYKRYPVRTASGDIHGELQVSFALGDKLVPSGGAKKKAAAKQKKNQGKPAGHEYPIMRAPKKNASKGANVPNGQAPAAAKSVNASNGQVPVRLPSASSSSSSSSAASASASSAPYNYHNYYNNYYEPATKAGGNLAPYRPEEYSAAYRPAPSPPITHTMMKPHQTYVGSPDHGKIPSDSPAPPSSSLRSHSPHTIFASPLGKVLLTDLSKPNKSRKRNPRK